MARRMLDSRIVGSDAFVSLPVSAQAVYLQLVFEADDDGFINNTIKTALGCGGSKSDVDALVSNRFILKIDTVYVIKAWRMMNTIRKERKKDTVYKEQLAKLTVREDGCYTLSKNDMADISLTNGGQNADTLAAQVKLSKVKLSKVKLSKEKTLVHFGNERCGGFETFWKEYPKKIGKQKCLNWFKAHKVSDDLLSQMLRAIEEQKESDQWLKDNGQFIPHPYTWLNQGRWEDEVGGMEIDNKDSQELTEEEEKKMRDMLEKISKPQ
jgi:hypothetical protein